MCSQRNLEEVRRVITLAKLTENELKRESFVLDLSKTMMDKKQFKLFEVSKPMLEYLSRGESLILRGLEDDSAILCTDDATYDIKEAETSNSLLLMPLMKNAEMVEQDETRTLKGLTVKGIYHTYFELKPVRPKLQRLRATLKEHAYRGRDRDDSDRKGLGFSDLKDEIQMSESELLDELNNLSAIRLNGKWRFLDLQLQYDWLTRLVQQSRGTLPSTKDEVLSIMDDFDIPAVSVHCAEMFLVEKDGALSFHSARVAELFASCLFQHSREYALDDFVKVMDEVLPPGLPFDKELLRGLALVDPAERPPRIVYLPEYSLPEDFNERFQILFRRKAKWTLEEITPYVQPLISGKQTVTGILTKYSRASVQNGIKYYGAKYTS